MRYPVEKAVFEAKLSELRAVIEVESEKMIANEITWDEFYPNKVEESKLERIIRRIPPVFEIGDGVSINGYSDITPFEVIAVSASGKTVTIREMKATRSPDWKPEMIPGGFSAICTNNSEQKWVLESDEGGTVRKISLRIVKLDPRYNAGIDRVSKWVPVGDKATISSFPVINKAMKFYDYNF